MNKQTNPYQTRLYVNDITSYKNPTSYHSVTSTVPYNPTYKDTPTSTHTQNTTKCPSLQFFYIYLLYQNSQTFVTTLIQIFTISNIMTNWESKSDMTTSGLENFIQLFEVNIISHVCPHMRVCCKIIL